MIAPCLRSATGCLSTQPVKTGRLLCQSAEQLGVDSTEAAIAHNKQYIAGVYVRDNMSHNVIHPFAEVALRTLFGNIAAEFFFIQSVFGAQSLVVFYRGDDGEICRSEGLCQFGLEKIANGGIASGVE